MGIFRHRRKRDAGPSEATIAREQAEADLAATRAETPKIKALAEALAQLRVDNHFADHIAESFRGDR